MPKRRFVNFKKQFAKHFVEKMYQRKKPYRFCPTRSFIKEIWAYLQTAQDPEAKEIQALLEQWNLDEQKFFQIIEHLSLRLKEHFLEGKVCYVPGLGYFGYRVKPNKTKIFAMDIAAVVFDLKSKPTHARFIIIPNFIVYKELCKKVINNPVRM